MNGSNISDKKSGIIYKKDEFGLRPISAIDKECIGIWSDWQPITTLNSLMEDSLMLSDIPKKNERKKSIQIDTKINPKKLTISPTTNIFNIQQPDPSYKLYEMKILEPPNQSTILKNHTSNKSIIDLLSPQRRKVNKQEKNTKEKEHSIHTFITPKNNHSPKNKNEIKKNVMYLQKEYKNGSNENRNLKRELSRLKKRLDSSRKARVKLQRRLTMSEKKIEELEKRRIAYLKANLEKLI